MILRVNHAQVTIPKGAEAQARDFYCGTLGLKEIPRPVELQNRGGFWMEVGDIQLHIGTEDGVDRAATKAHLSYEVDDLQSVKNALSSIGITVQDVETVPGYLRSQFRDPFGNRIELMQSS